MTVQEAKETGYETQWLQIQNWIFNKGIGEAKVKVGVYLKEANRTVETDGEAYVEGQCSCCEDFLSRHKTK